MQHGLSRFAIIIAVTFIIPASLWADDAADYIARVRRG